MPEYSIFSENTTRAARAAFDHGKPVVPLIADDSSAAGPREDDPARGRPARPRDCRGEFACLAVPFDADDTDGFRDRRRIAAETPGPDRDPVVRTPDQKPPPEGRVAGRPTSAAGEQNALSQPLPLMVAPETGLPRSWG